MRREPGAGGSGAKIAAALVLTLGASAFAGWALRRTRVARPPVHVAETGAPLRRDGYATERERGHDEARAVAAPISGGAATRGAVIAVVPAIAADDFVDGVGVMLDLDAQDTPFGDPASVFAQLRRLGVRNVTDTVEDGGVDEVPLLLASGCRVLAIVDRKVDVAALAHRLGPRLTGITLSDPGRSRGRDDAGWAAGLRADLARLQESVASAGLAGRLPIVAPDVGIENAEIVGDISALVDYGRLQYPLDGDPPFHPKLELALHGARRLYGTRPLMVPSLSYTTAKSPLGVSEEVQAKYTPRLLFELRNRGIDRVYLRYLLDLEAKEISYAGHFGLVRVDGSPKPAFFALRDLLAVLGDPGAPFKPRPLPLEIDAAGAQVHHTLLARRNGSYVLALWLETRSGDDDVEQDVTVTVGLPLQAARLHRPGSGSLPAPIDVTEEGRMMLRVSDRVMLLDLTPRAAR